MRLYVCVCLYVHICFLQGNCVPTVACTWNNFFFVQGTNFFHSSGLVRRRAVYFARQKFSKVNKKKNHRTRRVFCEEKILKNALTVTFFSICARAMTFLRFVVCLFTEGGGSLEALRNYMDFFFLRFFFLFVCLQRGPGHWTPSVTIWTLIRKTNVI